MADASERESVYWVPVYWRSEPAFESYRYAAEDFHKIFMMLF